MKKFRDFFLGLLIFIIIILFVLFFLKVAWEITRDLNDTQETLLVITIPLLAPILGTYLSNRQSMIKEFELRNREKKESAYDEFVDLLYQYISAREDDTDKIIKERLTKLMKSRKNLLVWGSDEVVKNYGDFMKHTQENNTEFSTKALTELLKSIRKDLGYKNNKIKSDHIARYLK